MDKQRWINLLEEVYALNEEERRPYLEKTLAGEPTFLREAIRIIEGHNDDFITSFGELFPEWLNDLGAEETEAHVGPYRIIEMIGKGGMGEVFKAVQEEPVRRTVALKILDFSHRSEASIRFRAEYQALAFMEHPAIAHVYQCGVTGRGRPYFTMEYYHGRPITDFCRAEGLSLRDQVALMVRVCAGVEHAHQKGIIHRDLKPSNILVMNIDGEACPKIIDFGIAKAIGDQELTERPVKTAVGAIVGTLSYMSPEQVENRPVDTRTDIYALGTLLYELATGTLPFGRDRFNEIPLLDALSIIREERPESPHVRARKQGRRLPRDLDAIILKTLTKRPEHRYGSTGELIADLKRFLEDRPVYARSPGFLYAMSRFFKRNKIAVIASVVVLAALIGGGVASFLSWRQEQVIARRFEVVNQFLLGVLTASNPDVDGRETKVVRLLDRAAARLDADFRNQPADRALLARTLGDTYRSLGFYDEAARILGNSVIKCLAELGPLHPETLETRFVLARLCINLRQYKDAENQYRLLLGQHDLIDKSRMRQVRKGLAIALNGQDALAEAEQIYREVMAEEQRDPGHYHADTASTMANLAINLRIQGRLAEAADLLAEALEIQVAVSAEPTQIMRTRSTMARLLNDTKQFEAAERAAGELYHERLRQLGPDHPRTSGMLYEVCRSLYGQNRYDEARMLIETVLQNRMDALGHDHRETASALVMAGLIDFRLGLHDRAIANLSEALDIRIRVQGPSRMQTVDALADLTRVLMMRGECKQAMILLCRGLPDPPPASSDDAASRAWENLAQSLDCLGYEQEAGQIRAQIAAL